MTNKKIREKIDNWAGEKGFSNFDELKIEFLITRYEQADDIEEQLKALEEIQRVYDGY